MRDEAAGAPPPAPGGRAIDQAGELRSSRIESLRAIAALGVLVGHYFVATNGSAAFASFGDRLVLGTGFGVLLFFTLSGYLLFWPFAKRDFAGDGPIDLRRYARNRALRILPLYFVVLVVVLLAQEDGGTLRQWLVFSSFSENFFLDTVTTVNGVMWTLVVELHFYLLLPLLAAGLAAVCRGSLGRAALVLGALGAASLALRTATVTLDDSPDPRIEYSILTLFFFFVSGMAVALVRVRMERSGSGGLPGPLGSTDTWIAGAAVVWLIACSSYDLDSALAAGGFLLVGACVLPLRPGPLVRLLEWRVLAAVGIASYSLYLWHGPFAELLYDDSLGGRAFLPSLLLGGSLTILLAFVSYRLVESPFLRLRRRWARAAAVQQGAEVSGPEPARPGGAPRPRTR